MIVAFPAPSARSHSPKYPPPYTRCIDRSIHLRPTSLKPFFVSQSSFTSVGFHAASGGSASLTSGRPCAGILRTSFDAPSHRKSPVFKITPGPLISIHLQLQYYNIRSDGMVPSFEMALKTGDVLYLRACSRPTSRVLDGVISAMLLTESRRERGWRQLGMFF